MEQVFLGVLVLSVALMSSCAVTLDTGYLSPKYTLANNTQRTESEVSDLLCATLLSGLPSPNPDHTKLPVPTFSTVSSTPESSLLLVVEGVTPDILLSAMPALSAAVTKGARIQVSGDSDPDHLARILTASLPAPSPLRDLAHGIRKSTKVTAISAINPAWFAAGDRVAPVAEADAVAALATCGVTVTRAEDGSFAYGEVTFAKENAAWVVEAATLCRASPATTPKQPAGVTAVLLSGPRESREKLGANSTQHKAVVAILDAVASKWVEAQDAYVVVASPAVARPFTPATDGEDLSRVPHLKRTLPATSKSTAGFHIVLWFTILLVVVVAVTFIVMLGVGSDACKDTLLYRSTVNL